MGIPAQKDWITGRYRTIAGLDPYEYEIQMALNELLKLMLRDNRVEWWHTPNGGLRDIKTAAKFKAMGVRPGVADFFFTWGEPVSVVGEPKVQTFARNLFLELKRRGGDLSEAQEQFRDSVTAKGSWYEVADSIDAAVEILKRYGVLRKSNSGGLA
jgi:hypothetical protein